MAGYATRTPITAAAEHLLPVAPTPSATQAEPVALGSQSLVEVIAVGMGQITDEAKKVPQSAVQGLAETIAALEAQIAGLAAIVGSDQIVVFEADVYETGVFT